MNTLWAILNKAIIITTAPLLISTATLNDGRVGSNNNQVGEPIYTDKEIKEFEFGSDTFGIVLDDQQVMGTDDFLTSGSDESTFVLDSESFTTGGMLGQGGEYSNQYTATPVDLNGDGTDTTSGYIKEIEMGEYFSGAITHEYDGSNKDGLDRMYMWGSDIYGATIPELGEDLGSHTSQTFYSPVAIDINHDGVDGMTNSIDRFTIGIDHAGAIVKLKDGGKNPYEVYSWGVNDEGQTGHSTGSSLYEAPAQIDLSYFMQDSSSEITFKDYEFGNKVSYAIVNDSFDGRDHLYAWGDNTEGQLGFVGEGSKTIYTTPTELVLNDFNKEGEYPSDMEMIEVESAATASFALTKYGTDINGDPIYHVYAWGLNEKSILGTPADWTKFEEDVAYAPTELDVDGKEGGDSAGIVRDIEVNPLGYNFYASIYNADEDLDHLYAWGDNTQGQIGWWEGEGVGTETSKPIDLDINGDGVKGTVNEIYQISAGKDSAAAMFETRDGTQQKLYMWGDNSQGEFGWGEDEGVVDPELSITGDSMLPQLVYQSNIADFTGDNINETAKWLKWVLLVTTIIAVALLVIAIII